MKLVKWITVVLQISVLGHVSFAAGAPPSSNQSSQLITRLLRPVVAAKLSLQNKRALGNINRTAILLSARVDRAQERLPSFGVHTKAEVGFAITPELQRRFTRALAQEMAILRKLPPSRKVTRRMDEIRQQHHYLKREIELMPHNAVAMMRPEPGDIAFNLEHARIPNLIGLLAHELTHIEDRPGFLAEQQKGQLTANRFELQMEDRATFREAQVSARTGARPSQVTLITDNNPNPVTNDPDRRLAPRTDGYIKGAEQQIKQSRAYQNASPEKRRVLDARIRDYLTGYREDFAKRARLTLEFDRLSSASQPLELTLGSNRWSMAAERLQNMKEAALWGTDRIRGRFHQIFASVTAPEKAYQAGLADPSLDYSPLSRLRQLLK